MCCLLEGQCRRPCIKAVLMPEVKQKKSFLKVPPPIGDFNTVGAASLAWKDAIVVLAVLGLIYSGEIDFSRQNLTSVDARF